MAHIGNPTENLISAVRLPDGKEYEIHDASAIHDISELGLSQALVFRGALDHLDDLYRIEEAKVGDVYLIRDTNTEYVCIIEFANALGSSVNWERLGDLHDAASTRHWHNATVTGTNVASAVTGKVKVPKVTKGTKTATGAVTMGDVDKTAKSVLGANTKFAVTGGAGTGGNLVTSTASKVSATNVSIPNVTGNTSVSASLKTNDGIVDKGTAASWSASVTNGLLSFAWTANTPTDVSLPTFTEVSASKVTLGTALNASKVTANDVTVATGTINPSGAGDAVVTSISAISVSASGDNVDALTDVVIDAGSVSVEVDTVSIDDTTYAHLEEGIADAQRWTQTEGITGEPIEPTA